MLVSATPHEIDPPAAADDLAAARGVPCTFAGLAGVYHAARGDVGVVLCAPWGFEDLTMRKSWRLLAEALAAADYPCLRFDYPGTGNSAGRATDPSSARDWVDAIGTAANLLRDAGGAKKLVFIGQTLGATLAVEAARCRDDVVGLHLIAPVIKGRAHARELAATSKLVADRLGIGLAPNVDEALSVMGFALSAPMVESLRALDLTRIDRLGAREIVVYDQDSRKAITDVLAHFRTLGAHAELEPVEPFHLMVSDATIIQPLPVQADRLASILRAKHPIEVRSQGAAAPLPSVLDENTFREEPIRFGADDGLFGILCTPPEGRADRAVILLNRGLNPHVGWRRVSVDHARGLAAAGIASLRIDVAGLGESPDVGGRPPNPIYSELLVPDVSAAVDALATRGYARIMLAGVCSGAYIALLAADADPRITDILVVNAQRFVWNPKESIEDVIRYGLRSMNDYVGDIRSGGALKKLIRSRKRIVPAMAFLARKKLKNASARIPLRLRSLLLRGSMARRVERMFSSFAARGTRVSLCFSAGDPGLMELSAYFGPNGRDLRHPNVSISIIPDADHNLTTTRASNWMLEHMIDVAGEGRREPQVAARNVRTSAGVDSIRTVEYS